ncbi:MAG: hypothetical protein AMXMBFR23_04260 [Chloroflexota bacterium]
MIQRVPWASLRPDRVGWAVIAIAATAFVMRIVGLEVRALHHDESLHATYSYYFAQGDGYRHNPLMHGPFQFHIMAAFFWLFGDGDAMARWPHAIFGTALVTTPLLLRRWLGGPGTVLAALFLCVSPSVLYYTRFAREDAFIALFTVLQVIALWRYRDDGRERWLLLFAAMTAFAFATKESAYLTAAVLLVYLDLAVAHRLFWDAREGERVPLWRQALGGAWLIPTAWIFAALWRPLRPLRERLGLRERPREADLLVLLGTLVLPMLAAAVRVPWERFGGPLEGDALFVVGLTTVLVLWAGATVVGLLWDAARWSMAIAVFMMVTILLYTTFGTNPDGIAGPFWTSLDYWIEQHDVERGKQPWFYYVMLLPLYESLVLWPALAAGPWLVARRRDPLAALLVIWFAGTMLALSVAGEKMPWLTVHLAIPLSFLAAYALGGAVSAALPAVRERRGAPWRWALGGVGATFVVGAFALAVHANVGLNVRHPDTPVEPMIYVQTSPHVPPLARTLRERLAADPEQRVVIDTTASLTWPWAWYLRGTNVTYLDGNSMRNKWGIEPDDILLAVQGTITRVQPMRLDYEPGVPFVHRHWFREDGYRATTWASFGEGLRDGSLLRRWAQFLVERGSPEGIGTMDAEVLYPRGTVGVTGP